MASKNVKSHDTWRNSAVEKNKKHIELLERMNIPQVDLVVVNLYPFEEIREKSCGNEIKLLKALISEVPP